MSLPPFGVTKLADICVACFQSGFFNHEYPPAQPPSENPAHLSKLKWLLWICIHQRRESNERSKQQPSNKLSAKRPSSSSGHGDNQPSVGAAQWAGLGGSALCYIHQTQLLMTIGAGLLSAGGALLGATISPSIMSQTSRVSPPVTSTDCSGPWIYFIFHVWTHPTHCKLYANYPQALTLTCFLSWYSSVIHHCDVLADTATDVITLLSIFFSATCCRVVEASA